MREKKSPLYERCEEGGVEVQGRIGDLLWKLAEEGHQIRVEGSSHACTTFVQKSPKFGQEAFLGIHMCPAILIEAQKNVGWDTRI